MAIIGAGASGTIVAAQLLRDAPSGLRIVLIDSSDHGPGVAYSTTDPCHLVNVPAARMSAFDDDPDDLLRWCRDHDIPADDETFVPRSVFGDYLRSQLLRYSEGRLDLVRGRATSVNSIGNGNNVEISGHTPIRVNVVVLALGNAAPSLPAGLLAARRCVIDPWAPGALAELEGARRVAVIGTGMTAVDVILSASDRSPKASVLAISRHGWLPRAHDVRSLPQSATASEPTDLVTAVADALNSRRDDWRQAVDALRPHTQRLWQRMTVADKEEFLREVKPWWDVHRHRMPPQTADRLDALIRAGQVRVIPGSVEAIDDRRPTTRIKIRSHGETVFATADVIINATGPSNRVTDTQDPLLQMLLASGQATADDLGIGLACDRLGRLVNAKSEANSRLFTLGPLRRGELFESVAIPEIRAQAHSMSREILPALLGPPRNTRLNRRAASASALP